MFGAPSEDVRDVEALNNYDGDGLRRLTDWEVAFAESLYERVVEEGAALNVRQREKLNEILEEVGL